MFSIDGLVSGFDTTSIIESLLQFQQTQVDLFNSRKSEITSRQSAFGGIEAQLLSLRSALGKLNRVSSVFDARTAVSSNEDILTATAGSDAATGSFTLTVNSLATAEQLGSQGYSSASAEVGTGTFSLQVGTRPAVDIEVDSSNNSLTGLANAINDQAEDVSASVVFDQGSDSYRLLLTSNQTGEENTIQVTSTLSGGTGPTFTGDPVQAAANASVTLGSGPGAITAEYSTNQIDELISGVTLDLKSADVGSPVTVNIQADTESAAEAIEDFVDSFNKVIEFIDNQTAFNPETNFASPLLGNRNVNLIRDELINSVIENVPGLETGLSRLADIGVDIDTTGKLELDSTRLNDALAGRIEGINPADIRNLFGLNASSTNQGIEFLLGSDATTATGEPIQVDIIQAAEQASVTAGRPLAGSIVIDGSNNEFTINISGTESETLTIAAGTYTQEELAEQIQSVINNSSELGSRDVTVSAEGGSLSITTESYGSDAEISNITGTAAETLGFDGTESDIGQDVAGTFIVNGQTETAVGNGRLLVGDPDNENTADLQVLVTLTGDQIVSGVEAELSVTRGISSTIDQFLADVLDPENGTLSIINEDFDEQIASIDASIARVQEQTEAQRDRLIAEFTALESVLAELQNTGNLLTSQLANLTGFSTGR